jgi:hypothetical protein
MVMLTRREKDDVSDADVTMDWMLYTVETLVIEGKRES